MADSSRWKDKEIELLKKLRASHSPADISEAFSTHGFDRSPEAISRKARYLGVVYSTDMDKNDSPDDSYSRTWRELLAIKQEYAEEYIHRGVCADGTKLRKILCISDFHIPFERDDLIAKVIKEHKDADVCVLNGDFLDMHAVSTWPKERIVILQKEYEIGIRYLEILSKTFPLVVLTRGNHDFRLNRYFHMHVDPAVSFLVDKDILSHLKRGEIYNTAGEIEKTLKFDNVIYEPGQEAWFTKIGKTMFLHPMTYSRINGRTSIMAYEYFMDREDIDSVVVAHCFDQETEILTEAGWRTIDTIQKDDRPITLKLQEAQGQGCKPGELEPVWLEPNPISGIHIYDTYKELIRFSNSDGLDIRVTPEHGMLARAPSDSKTWKKFTAQELEENGPRFYIPVSGLITPDIEGYPIGDDKLRLLAWIQTECNFVRSKRGDSHYIRIAQSDTPRGYTGEIEKVLCQLKLTFTKKLRYEKHSMEDGQYRNYDAYIYSLRAEECAWVEEFMNEDKSFKWSFLAQLSLTQRRLLVEELCKGDGSKCSTDRWRAFYQKNEIIRDQFQMLATTCGLRTKYKVRKDGTYVLHLSDIPARQPSKIERIPYNGRVWCLSVPNGTLIARRNGVVFLTQNTHQQSRIFVRGKLCIEQGCLCVPLDYEKQGKLIFKPQTLGYAIIYQDKNGNTDFNKSQCVYLGIQYPSRKTKDKRLLALCNE